MSKALDKRIKQLAKAATVDELGKLAHAYSEIHHGPQGGSKQLEDHSSYEYDYRPPAKQELGFRRA